MGLADLTDAEVEQIACGARQPVERVRAARDAEIIAADPDIARVAIGSDLFYGLIRQGLPPTTRELLAVPAAQLRSALGAAVAARQLGLLDAAALDAAHESLVAAQVDLAFVAPDPGTTSNLAELLYVALDETAGSAPLSRKLAELYARRDGSIEAFWEEVGFDAVALGGCIGWLRANTGAWEDAGGTNPCEDGTSVILWQDQSTTGHDAAGGATPPIYRAAGGSAGLDLDGIDLTAAALTVSVTEPSTSTTVVVRLQQAGAGERVALSCPGKLRLSIDDGTGQVALHDAAGVAHALGPTGAAGDRIYTWVIDGAAGTAAAYLDGELLGSASGLTLAGLDATSYLGSLDGSSGPLGSIVHELLVYRRALEVAELARLHAYVRDHDMVVYSAAQVARVQLTLQWGALGRYHLPLVQRLEELRLAGTAVTLRDLGMYTEADWLALLDSPVGGAGGPAVGYPADMPGADDAEKKANYAAVLARSMEAGLPTAHFHGQLLADGSPDPADANVAPFLGDNLDFELGKTRVDAFWAGADLSSVPPGEQDALKVRLKKHERVFKLTGRYAEMKALLAAGLDASAKVARMGEAQFVKRHGASFESDSAAKLAHCKAQQIAAHATGLWLQLSEQANWPPLITLPSFQSSSSPPAVAADWESLFGKHELCTCKHCRSVYSPAAYLVDLLQLIGRYDSLLTYGPGGQSAWTAKDVLIGAVDGSDSITGRRPDIAKITLSCENTNTALPYVDLVNEILERHVGADVATALDTISVGASSEELLATPEVLDVAAHDKAYQRLSEHVHPWALPFSLWQKQQRIYLEHLGVPRHRLMRLMQRGVRPSEIAGCRLWLRADLGVVVADGRVERWIDLSGNGNDAVQDEAAARPYYGASGGSEDQPYLELRGAERLMVPDADALDIANDSTATLVVITSDLSGNGWLLAKGAMGVAWNYGIQRTGGKLYSIYHTQYVHGPDWATEGATARIAITRQSGLASPAPSTDWRIDGVETSGGSLLMVPSTQPLHIGAQPTGAWPATTYSNYLTGRIYEIILYQGEPSLEDLQALEAYAAERYGAVLAPLVPALWPAELQIAQERLEMASQERKLIVGEPVTVEGTAAQPWDVWGLAEGSPPDTWDQQLKTASTFVDASGLSYQELEELLDSRLALGFAVAGERPRLDPAPGTSGCNLDDLRIAGLDEASLLDAWGALHRLLRLRLRLGWTLRGLDKVLSGLGAALDDALVEQLGDIAALRERRSLARLGLAELAAWWGDLDTQPTASLQEPSLYESLFLSKALDNPALDAFALDSLSGSIDERLEQVLAAITMTAADYRLLSEGDEALSVLRLHPAFAGHGLSLSSLSRLYRLGSLARAARLRMSELLVMQALSGLAPLAGDEAPLPSSPEQTRLLFEELDRVEQSGLRIAEIHYLVRHVVQPGTGVEAVETAIEDDLEQLDAGLAKITEQTSYQPDPSGAALRSLLTEVMTADRTADPAKQAIADQATIAADVDAVMAILEGDNGLGYDAQLATLSDKLAPFFDDVASLAAELAVAPYDAADPLSSSCQLWLEGGSGLGQDSRGRVAEWASLVVGSSVKARPLAPADLPDCVLWLRAEQASITADTAGRVSAWTDQVNPANQALQPTQASQPTFTAIHGAGGYPGVDFDGADDWLDLDYLSQSSNDHTVVVVCRPRTTASAQVALSSDATGGVALAAATPSGNAGYHDGTAWREATAAVEGEQILTWVLDAAAAEARLYRDGALLQTVAYDGTGGWAAGSVDLGRSMALSSYLDGVVSEVIAFSRALDPGDLGLLHAMLSSRYGLGAERGALVVDDGPFGLPAVRLSGAGDMLLVEGLPAFGPSSTLMCAIGQRALAEGKGMALLRAEAATGEILFATQGADTAASTQVALKMGTEWAELGAAQAGEQLLGWVVADGAPPSVTSYRDGEPLGSASTFSAASPVAGTVALGGFGTDPAIVTFDGTVALMGLFDAALDGGALSRLHQYLYRLSGDERRYERVHQGLLDFARRRDATSFAKQSLAAAHDIAAESASTLLGGWLQAFSKPSGYLIEDLLPPTFAEPTPVAEADRRRAVTRFAKSALLVSRLAIDERELSFLAAGPVAGWLDLDELPVQPFGPIVRFDADRTALLAGELELPPWLTITCATVGRTVQIGPSRVRSGFARDAARAHSLDGAHFGLAVEPAATNLCDDDSIETWAAQGSYASISIVVPDGAEQRNTLDDLDATAVVKQTHTVAAGPSPGWHTLSAWGWVHAPAPSSGAMLPEVTGVTPALAIDAGTGVDEGWTLRSSTVNLTAAPGPVVVELVPRHTAAADQGQASLWGVQIEPRRYPTSFVGSAAGFSRAADALRCDLTEAGLAADGYFRVTLRYAPMYASDETAGIHDLVYFDSQNRVYFDGSQLILRVNNTLLGSGPIPFGRMSEITIFAEHAPSGRTLRVTVDGSEVGEWTAAALAPIGSQPTVAYILGNTAGAQEGAVLRLLDWTGDDLPEARARYRALMRMVDGLALRDAFRAQGGSLVELLAWMGGAASPSQAEVLAAIAESTGWAPELVQGAAAALGLSHPLLLQSEAALIRLRDLVLALRRLGADAAMAASWLDVDEDAAAGLATADAIVRTAKAKHGRERWLEVARPLRDPLREAQRQALLAYALHAPPADPPPASPIETADDLYAYLLLDVEMSPCMLTSRIKHAIGTVQLFIQRCLMNLEPDVPLGRVAAREYAWMRNYRVWEANRKVFLYPENWLEPEWRDDKTPLFEQLESTLRQGELTDERAEAAFGQYLEGLGEVGRLDLVGMVHHREQGTADKPPVDTLHVLGRSYSERPRYYHRSWVDQTWWTPWRLLDIEINTDQFIPIIVGGRLVIVGANFEQVEHHSTEKHVYLQWETSWWWTELRGEAWTLPAGATGRPKWYWAWTVPSLEHFSLFRVSQPSGDQVQALGFSHSWAAAYEYFNLMPAATTRWAFANGSFNACADLHVGEAGFAERYLPSPATMRPAALDYVIANSSGMELSGVLQLWATATNQVALLTGASDYAVHAERIASASQIIPFDELFFKGLSSRDTYFAHPVLVPTTPAAPSGGPPIEDDPNVPRSASWSDPEQVSPKAIPGFQDDSLLAKLGQWATKPAMTMLIPIHVEKKYRFEIHHHPYVCDMLGDLRRGGAQGVQRWTDQLRQDDHFSGMLPTDKVALPYPLDELDFSFGGAYSAYNWELFFHAPYLIATRLMAEERHDEARRWLQAIFDPTDASDEPGVRRFWKIRPFYENDDLADVQADMGSATPTSDKAKILLALFGAGAKDDKVPLSKQIAAWRKDPFRPFLVARMRITAFQKATVMRYIDNLIAWGDKLFRRDTIESTGEATQLYLLAKALLGERPTLVDDPEEQAPLSYEQILAQGGLDAFSNHVVELESLALDPPSGPCVSGNAPPPLLSFYFCFPPNDKLLALWDVVEDRLFKLRHCMNIEGVVRELPLFEPPIDPALLIDAVANGVDIQSVLDELASPQPHYRFSVLLPKAVELVQTVISFGGALLAALEKRDAEGLALLRQQQEIGLLDLVRQVRKDQVAEAKEGLAALEASRKVAEERLSFYQDVVKISEDEESALNLSEDAARRQDGAAQYELMGNAAAMYPDLALGVAGMGAANWVAFGGSFVSKAFGMMAASKRANAAHSGSMAATTATLASYGRRWDEWKLQERLADKEIAQIDKQIAAGELRVAISEGQLDNTEQQRKDAKAVEELLKTKFTGEKLYDWTVEQMSEAYYQAYQVAYEVCKAAEQAYRHERAEPDARFIRFGYWDSRRKGLVAGEKLLLDLRRMDAAYLKKNRREYELVKQISLAEHFPAALVELRETGSTSIALQEKHFDLDYPGHYLRRIKSASLTIPAVSGPHGGVHCTLTLLKSRIRAESVLADGQYEEEPPLSDPRFLYHYGAISSVCTSSGQNDAGLFELSFRDERYLPFEGAGAVSSWRLELPAETNTFDLRTVSDVVLNLSYSAREGGAVLRGAALEAALASSPRQAWRLLRASQDLATAWNAFETELDGSGNQVLVLELSGKLPFVAGTGAAEVVDLRLATMWGEQTAELAMSVTGLGTDPVTVPPVPAFVPPMTADSDVPTPLSPEVPVTVTVPAAEIAALPSALRESWGAGQRIKPEALVDLVILVKVQRAGA